jgi:hypothetical protein
MPRSIRSSSILLMPILALWLVPLGARAQCDPAVGCSSCATKGERLECKFDSLMDEGKKTIDELQKPPYDTLLPPAQLEGLAKTRENLDRGKSRLQSDDFHLLAKKEQTSCQLVESQVAGAVHNDDGVCDPDPPAKEDCAEVLGDGIGDDDGICSPLKGKKREVCVQICDEEAVLQDESNVDDEKAAELEGIYDNLVEHSREVNEGLPEAGALILATRAASDPSDPCAIDAQGLSRTTAVLRSLARGAAVGARGGADIAERLCDTVVFGFNCGACCAPGEAIAGGLQAASTSIEMIEETINSATIDAALTCVAAMKQTAGDNNAMLLQIQMELDQAQVEQAEIIRLLRTPLGQRKEETQ